jgi:hypothetical protein
LDVYFVGDMSTYMVYTEDEGWMQEELIILCERLASVLTTEEVQCVSFIILIIASAVSQLERPIQLRVKTEMGAMLNDLADQNITMEEFCVKMAPNNLLAPEELQLLSGSADNGIFGPVSRGQA